MLDTCYSIRPGSRLEVTHSTTQKSSCFPSKFSIWRRPATPCTCCSITLSPCSIFHLILLTVQEFHTRTKVKKVLLWHMPAWFQTQRDIIHFFPTQCFLPCLSLSPLLLLLMTSLQPLLSRVQRLEKASNKLNNNNNTAMNDNPGRFFNKCPRMTLTLTLMVEVCLDVGAEGCV